MITIFWKNCKDGCAMISIFRKNLRGRMRYDKYVSEQFWKDGRENRQYVAVPYRQLGRLLNWCRYALLNRYLMDYLY